MFPALSTATWGKTLAVDMLLGPWKAVVSVNEERDSGERGSGGRLQGAPHFTSWIWLGDGPMYASKREPSGPVATGPWKIEMFDPRAYPTNAPLVNVIPPWVDWSMTRIVVPATSAPRSLYVIQ